MDRMQPYVGRASCFLIFYARNLVLLFGAIALFSAGCPFVLWNRNGRPCMEDDNYSIFSDWKSEEKSPVKVSLIETFPTPSRAGENRIRK